MSLKKNAKGLRAVHYTGLPGFHQDRPCSMDVGEDDILFSTTTGAHASLPLSKVECVDIMPEANYMLRYHNSSASTAKVGDKWYAVITCASEGASKHITLWFLGLKAYKAFYALQRRCAKSTDVIL